MHFGDHAVMQATAPEVHSAAGASLYHLDVFQLRRAQRYNAAVPKIAFIVECAGIAKIAGQPELCQHLQPLTIFEGALGTL
jgi:hypothetical protein